MLGHPVYLKHSPRRVRSVKRALESWRRLTGSRIAVTAQTARCESSCSAKNVATNGVYNLKTATAQTMRCGKRDKVSRSVSFARHAVHAPARKRRKVFQRRFREMGLRRNAKCNGSVCRRLRQISTPIGVAFDQTRSRFHKRHKRFIFWILSVWWEGTASTRKLEKAVFSKDDAISWRAGNF
jgi:hypothetical protein